MKKVFFGLLFTFTFLALLSQNGQAQVSKHALARVARVAVAPVAHPKRSLKVIAGSLVFGVEDVVDVIHLGLDGLDKSFSTLDQSNEYFGVLYKIVSKADDLAAKADSGLEAAEDYFFGSHN